MYRQLSASTRVARPTGSQRRGFTLVELLVVITIIAMLVGLLIPAVQAARNAARKAQCMNNQRNLGLAIFNYATTKEKFPPAFTLQPDPAGVLATSQAVGWVPPILPHIEQNDLYQAFQNNTLRITPTAQIETLMCPVDDQSGSPAPLSYVVNAGARDSTQPLQPMDFPENGVFFDEFTPKDPGLPPANRPKSTPPIDLAYLSNHDGTKSTIMLSENLDARDWAIVGTASPLAPFPKPTFGNSWWNAITWEQPTTSGYAINWGMEGAAPIGRLNRPVTSPMPQDYERGRPYSNHSGGFMVTFCDAHTQFVSEEIQYRVYCLLMSPDSNNAKYTRPNAENGKPVEFPVTWWHNGVPFGTLTPTTDADIP